jgi:hypothetical protein
MEFTKREFRHPIREIDDDEWDEWMRILGIDTPEGEAAWKAAREDYQKFLISYGKFEESYQAYLKWTREPEKRRGFRSG